MDVHTALTRSGPVVSYMPIKQARKQTKTEALHFQRKTDKYTTDREFLYRSYVGICRSYFGLCWGLLLDVFNRLVEILRSVVILYTTGRRLHTDESLKPVVTGVEEDDDRCVYSK